MKQYVKLDPWKIIEDGFIPENNCAIESLCSIGNGRMGQRANFEEHYSGDTFQGTYIAGVYYPDKTKVGWWKNGYPRYFAKVLNATNWIGINVKINGEMLDLATAKVISFKRVLNMRKGYLQRTFIAKMPNGCEVQIIAQRFLSIVDDEIGAISYSVTPLNFEGTITFVPYLDGNIVNEDSNYNIKFWREVYKEVGLGEAYITVKTKKLDFHVTTGMKYQIVKNGKPIKAKARRIEDKKYVANSVTVNAKTGDEITFYKYVANLSSLNYETDELVEQCKIAVNRAYDKGYEKLVKQQAHAWLNKWKESDIIIEGDDAAQQGIRFNIFQLNQTYTGEDERLNIGPKGFTGEKYGGSTYWDTEAYCIPFFLATADEKVARNLLMYRHKHLLRAIDNAKKLGFNGGAALYPMVTMNGEECHNEWEITFEEIHRNGAIAYAIYKYVGYTNDKEYLKQHGIEVLVGIARFWAQRITKSEAKKKYVMLGVTGPNEYENNVNNNWYTNTIAIWCLKFTLETLDYIKEKNPEQYELLQKKLKLNIAKETTKWKDIIKNMHFPEDKKLNIFLQQDGYMDKEQLLAKDLDPAEIPINQHWSWDRILRSCFIKQADVLQGLYFFEDQYDLDTLRRNFDFYEPRTVHESSLSPCVHSILAAKLGYGEKAYDLYLRTARLDLDDYNNEVDNGCHITSMAGTWMSFVQGFGGMRTYDGKLSFSPFLPPQWKSYSFKIQYRKHILKISADKKYITIENQSNKGVTLSLFGKRRVIKGKASVRVKNK